MDLMKTERRKSADGPIGVWTKKKTEGEIARRKDQGMNAKVVIAQVELWGQRTVRMRE